MYIENLEKKLLNAGFEVEGNPEDGVMFIKKVSEKIQIIVVSTDIKNDDVMLIGEQELICANDKKYEDDEQNIIILSEFYDEDNFNEIMKKQNINL